MTTDRKWVREDTTTCEAGQGQFTVLGCTGDRDWSIPLLQVPQDNSWIDLSNIDDSPPADCQDRPSDR